MSGIQKCCINCEYYYATPEMGNCTIDHQRIPIYLNIMIKCPAFSLWWGVVDTNDLYDLIFGEEEQE